MLIGIFKKLKTQQFKEMIRINFFPFILIFIMTTFFIFFLLIPLIYVFYKAFEHGLEVYFASITDPLAFNAILLTIKVLLMVVPINTVFGITAAWAIAKFHFKGKNFIKTILDIPFIVSPIIAGMLFIFLFGSGYGIFSDFLKKLNVQIIFSFPGIVIATLFITLPFVIKSLIPIMESSGNLEEEAALNLGANGLQTFIFITLPNIKWALLSGIILTAAKTMGEFGAVSIVSGNIRGYTNTIPLHIETLYNEYKFSAAFAMASLLTIIGIFNLLIKYVLEKKSQKENSK